MGRYLSCAMSSILISAFSYHSSAAWRQTLNRYPLQSRKFGVLTSIDKVNHSEPDECSVSIRGCTITAQRGAILRTALLKSGIVSPHNDKSKLINCRGLGTCGTCAVEVVSGTVLPREPTMIERIRLGTVPPHSFDKNNASRLRLACQIRIDSANLELVKYSGFWGQKMNKICDEEASGKTYFGELEYIFDGGHAESTALPQSPRQTLTDTERDR